MERTSTIGRLALMTLGVASLLAGPAAHAHPHMWIDARATFAFDEAGRLSAITQRWLFDDMFSPYALQGLKKSKDGTFPAAALKSMADDWVKALGDPVSHYFTTVTVDGKAQKYAAPRDARVAWHDNTKRLSLTFTLPLAAPVALTHQTARIDIFDPTYFVAYGFDEKEAVTLAQAPAQCRSTYQKPRALDEATMRQLAAIPADPDPSALPEELFAITRGLTHRIEVTCP